VTDGQTDTESERPQHTLRITFMRYGKMPVFFTLVSSTNGNTNSEYKNIQYFQTQLTAAYKP